MLTHMMHGFANDGHLRCMKVMLRINYGVCDAFIYVAKRLLNFAVGKASFGVAVHHAKGASFC